MERLNFGKNFEEAVRNSDLTYAELARRLGVSKATISMYKSGKAYPSLPTFAEICDILDVSANFLLGIKDF